jgi:hypothetical protein
MLRYFNKLIQLQDNLSMKHDTRGLYIILFTLAWSTVMAQTDYIHFMNDRAPDKFVVSLAMNSQSYRELPGSPYACEVSDIDRNVSFQSSIHFTTPGKYTYFSRFRPDQLYGFRRMLDGNLQPLSGFPIIIPSIQDPVFGRGGIISLEKHPSLPLFYSIHARDDVIRTWFVQENGALLEHPESPFRILGNGLVGIQGFEMTDDATTFYLNTIFEGVIFKGSANPETGVLESYDVIYNHLEDGREILLSEDECYLYTTQSFSPVIGRYRIEDNGLTRLYPDFIADHEVVWLWRKDDLIVSGATNERLASTFLIQYDGSLIAGANSPFDVFSNTLWYAGFSPSQDRVYFGGNTFLQVYDIGPQGRMDLAPNSGLLIDGLALGLSVAPEVRGDPYSLSFIQPQSPEEPFRIQGDPQTVFYLRVADSCEGPYITDEAGFFETNYPRVPDQQLEILAYCDEAQVADAVFTHRVAGQRAPVRQAITFPAPLLIQWKQTDY